MSIESFLTAMIHDGGIKDSPELTPERIAELQAKELPAATCDVWGISIKDGLSADDCQAAAADWEILEKYLSNFLPPGPCPNCGRKGSFTWGICHGEGRCSCGYPGRGCHYPHDNNGEEILSLRDYVLWYHPKLVTAPAKECI